MKFRAMACYRDLSMFRYESRLLHGGLDVGWLTWRLPYRGGKVPEGFAAAPDLICHHVEMHRYLPPPKFIEAVLDRRKGLEAVGVPAGSPPNIRGREDRPGAR